MKSPTLKQYYEKPTALHTAVFSALKPKNGFAGQLLNVNAMPYTNTRHCIKLLQQTSIEAAFELFEVCFGVDQKLIWQQPAIDYFTAKAFIIQEFSILAEREQKMFSGKAEDEDLWKRAGADRLKPMSDILPLVNLGKAFSLYPFDVGRKPYGEVLNLLLAIKAQGEVENEFMKLKNS